MKIWKTFWFSVFLSCVVLLTAGYAYRVTARHLDALVKEPILPAIPLSVIPYQIGTWEGEDQPLSETILEVAGNDDYINRSYQDSDTGLYVNLYVAFTGQPRNMLGHRPRVCYVGAGWVHDGTEQQEIVLEQGEVIPVLLHYFHKPTPEKTRVVVLNYYLINGTVTSDYRDFSGIVWRLPTFSRKQIRYVAQVQVSSTSATAVRAFAPDIAPLIRSFMPVDYGQVK